MLYIFGELVDAETRALAERSRLDSAARAHQILAALHNSFALGLIGAQVETAAALLLSRVWLEQLILICLL